MKENDYRIHTIVLIASSVLGNLCITLPFFKSKNFVFLFLCCSVVTITVSLILSQFIKRFFNSKGFLFYLIAAITVLLSIYGICSAANDYIKFLTAIGGNKAVIGILLLILVCTLTFCQSRAFLKFSLLFGIISLFFIALMFIVSIRIYDASSVENITAQPSFKGIIICLLTCFSGCIPSIVFLTQNKCEINIKNTLSGLIAGFMALAICMAQSILVLGITVTEYKYPYLSAISANSLGQLYIRQDGFGWFIFFSAAIIKISVCTKAVWLIVKRMYKKDGNQN